MDYAKALKCAILAQDIYRDFQNIKFAGFPNSIHKLIQNPQTDTQSAIVPESSEDSIYIAFRGTENRNDWRTNTDFTRELFMIQARELPSSTLPEDDDAPRSRQIMPARDILPAEPKDLAEGAPGAKMHEGFVRAYMSVQDEIHIYLRDNQPSHITITGHSLGGALATLCAIDLQLTYQGHYPIELYTYGSPRVGNADFVRLFDEHLPKSYRFVYGLDIVPGVPRPWQGYRHVNTIHRMGSRWSWRFFTGRVTDHYIPKYIAELEKLAL